MKAFHFLGILLLAGTISLSSFAQLKLSIIWEKDSYLFYETKDLKKLSFYLENDTEEDISLLKNLSSTLIKKITIHKDKADGKTTGIIYFKANPTETDFKSILESLNINEFYVNNKKILTKSLIPDKEAKQKAMEFAYKDFLFDKIMNDTNRIEYYDFQIYYAQTKLSYMYANNYPKYLYEGYVSKFIELLEKQTAAREKFIQKSKN